MVVIIKGIEIIPTKITPIPNPNAFPILLFKILFLSTLTQLYKIYLSQLFLFNFKNFDLAPLLVLYSSRFKGGYLALI